MPTPTRLQDCALYEYAARRFQWIIWPIRDNRTATAARLERMRRVRQAIANNLKSDCQSHRFLSR